MFVHLVFESEYTFAYNQMIQKYSNISEHQFLISYKSAWDNSVEFSFHNSIKVDTFLNPGILESLNSCTGIIIHGLFNHDIVELLYRNQQLLTKTNWLLWGGDLYAFRETGTPANPAELEEKRKIIITKMKYISCAMREDYDEAQSHYKTKAEYMQGSYPFILDFKYLDQIKNISRLSPEVRILLGNSATETNCHTEALNLLEKFKNENIKIYCPLSYGDKIYGQKIIELGSKMFGEKFIPILSFLPPDEYSKLLSSIDIAVMNHHRQAAVGSIIALLYMGKKVYMKNDIASSIHFRSKGSPVCNMERLINEDFSEFTTYNKQSALEAGRFLGDDFSLEKQVMQWEAIFSKMLNDYNYTNLNERVKVLLNVIGQIKIPVKENIKNANSYTQPAAYAKQFASVSVVIPTYNREPFIEQAIKSIQAQTVPVSEIIVVDDASTDNTSELIARLQNADPRIKYLKLQKNSGAQAARNTGIKNASSEWVAFLDSDDIWLPGRVEYALKAAQAGKADVVYSNYIRREPDGTEVLVNPPQRNNFVYNELLKGSFVTFPGLFVKRNCFAETGFLDESIKSWQEWDTALRLSKQYRFAYDDNPGFIWIWHGGETISKDNKRELVGYLQIVLKYKDDILSICGADCLMYHINNILKKISLLQQSEDIIYLKNQVMTLKQKLEESSGVLAG